MATSEDSGARQIVDDHERSVADASRRGRGVHYTPVALARELVRQGVEALGREPRSICDPSCGAGALLVAAADALLAAGVAPEEIVSERLVGAELDPGAAAAASAALLRWCADVGGDPARTIPRIAVLDALDTTAQQWPQRPSVGFDLVVGNPPFLDQLDRTSARSADERAALGRRFGRLGPYCDTAALFLLVGIELVGDGGVVSMLQPQSFLAARDTAAVRGLALDSADLIALWVSDDRLFDAAVHVCAPVLRRREPLGSDRSPSAPLSPPGPRAPLVRVTAEHTAAGAPVRRVDLVHLGVGARGAAQLGLTGEPGPDGSSWAPLLAPSAGIPVPPVPDEDRPTLSSLASATAGFRDEYYALIAALAEGREWSPVDGASAPLVSVGMIDPATLLWGSTDVRVGGRTRRRPRVDLDRLAVDSPRVGRWAAARRCAKVLVASQGTVIEAVADPTGEVVALTPVITVEPHAAEDLWRVQAALLAPAVSARLVAQRLGTGRSTRSVRWTAAALEGIELPSDADAWAVGAELAERAQRTDLPERIDVLRECARVMCSAYLVDPDGPDGVELVDWWLGRIRKRLDRRGLPTAIDELLR